MRELTKKQKQMLKKWFDENYKGNYIFDLADEISIDLFDEIEAVHPTEIFLRQANHFLGELALNYTYKGRN